MSITRAHSRNPRRGNVPTSLLAVLLAALTLFSVYIGLHRTMQRESTFRRQHQSDEARRLLEAMSVQWRLRDQLYLHAARLTTCLEDLGIARGAQAPWAAISTRIWQRFPDTRLWLFEYPENAPGGLPRVIHAPAGGSIGRQAIAQLFHHLATRHEGKASSGSDERRITKLMGSLFGVGMEPAPVAQSLRGVPIRVTCERRQQYLVWDMVSGENGPAAGFIAITPETDRAKSRAMQRAASTVRSREVRWTGFIRAHPSRIGDLFPRPILRSRLFAGWCRAYRHIPFRERERTSPPWGERLGRYRLYTRPVLNCTHLAGVLLPAEPAPVTPMPFKAAVLLLAVVCLLVAVRGLLLGQWPVIPLAWRFLGLYALICALPLSVAIQTFSGYVDERRASILQGLERSLSSTLATIDQSKDQFQSRYLAAFSRITASPAWQKTVRERGIGAPGLAERMVGEFSTASPALPLSALFLFDMAGNELATYGPLLTPEQIDGIHKYFKIYLVKSLRSRHEITHKAEPPGKSPFSPRDDLFWEAFNQVSYTNMTQLAEMHRGIPEFIRAGSHWLVKLHDFIPTGSGELIAFLVAWHDKLLDREVIRAALIDFARQHPDGEFVAWRQERDRLVPLLPVSARQRLLLEKPAQAAMRQGGVFSARQELSEDWLIFARPSLMMRDICFSAALPVEPAFAPFEARRRKLLVVLWLSLMMVVLLGGVTAWRLVPSIASVHAGVTAVANGDLDVRMVLDRPDELGILTRAFDEMTDGLRERQRLSTFVSDVALQAVTTGTVTQPRRGPGIVLVSDIRSFTTLCENQPPHVITGLLNRHFDVMAEIVHRHGGRIDRFIGDAIQAVFEPSSAQDTDLSLRAVRAGVAMLAGVTAIDEERIRSGLVPYATGVGLCAGNLLFGGIGDPALRFEIVMLGEAVATATALEALSKSAPGIPLVMAPDIARECAPVLSRFICPLVGHETKAFTFRAGITPDNLPQDQPRSSHERHRQDRTNGNQKVPT
ncbi:MAG TPA: adenylate/guanylate cyclase domain-containing protein [Candidatus Ozemobacteraceae bacterium]